MKTSEFRILPRRQTPDSPPAILRGVDRYCAPAARTSGSGSAATLPTRRRRAEQLSGIQPGCRTTRPFRMSSSVEAIPIAGAELYYERNFLPPQEATTLFNLLRTKCA